MGSSWIRDQTHVSCIGRQIFYHWVTRKTQQYLFSMVQNSEGAEGYTGKSCPLHCTSATLFCPYPAYPFRMSLCRNKHFVYVLFHFCLTVQTFVLLFFLYWYILENVFMSVKKDSLLSLILFPILSTGSLEGRVKDRGPNSLITHLRPL